MPDFTCENCGKQLHLSDLWAGQTKTCVCGHQFVVPGSAPTFRAKLNNEAPERPKRSNKSLVFSGVVILAVVAVGMVLAELRKQSVIVPEDFAHVERGASLAQVRDAAGSDGEEVWTSTGIESMAIMMPLSAPGAVAVDFMADKAKSAYLPQASTGSPAPASEVNTLPSGYYRWLNSDGTGLHAVFLGDKMIWSLYVDEAMALLIKEMDKPASE
ncbi:MAG: hypothetical protein IT364_00275 [Candidatus Hydrogenedentes bacterium]|nr:hypothetical protein [Candidatus Hydrogenedentota bacterium]